MEGFLSIRRILRCAIVPFLVALPCLLSVAVYAEVIRSESFAVNKTKIRIEQRDYSPGGWVTVMQIEGEIGPDAIFLVESLLDEWKPLSQGTPSGAPEILFFLQSRGGYARDGIALGELIRKYNSTSIAMRSCHSSCAFAYLGGRRRGLEGNLSFHMPYVKDGDGIHCAKNTNNVKKYFTNMLGDADGSRLYERMKLYCSPTEGWSISDKKTATIYGLHKVD